MAIDLRGTDKADIIERFLEDSVAQGNEGDATVERLELNGVNYSSVTKRIGAKCAF
jgi:hypothetical protein